jgi:hypothetical protein
VVKAKGEELQASMAIRRMQYVPPRRRWSAAGVLLAALIVVPAAQGAGIGHAPEPVARIELEPMGYEGLQPEYLVAGSPMLTVDFIDDKHLLLTFEVRRLMKREVDAPPGEQDRTVAACLVEIATGKVLAKTEWRLHDRAQYLWNLGSGRFLLRIHDELSVFAPLAAKPQDAFTRTSFLVTNRQIVAVLLSADKDLLTVESTKRPDATAGDVAIHVGVDPTPVQINFYRIKPDDTIPMKMTAISAGAIRSRGAAALPITTSGYLDTLDGGKSTWYFNFDEHAGKVDELLAFDTTCFPHPVFVGHSEFVVFGCKGGDERRLFAGFNLRGEEMWQQGFYESYIAPTFAFAPQAGRFALGRTIVPLALPDDAALSASSVNTQDLRVYQMHSGRQLFRIDCSPVERSGQNFALSPDGLRVAVIREIEVRRKGTAATPAYTAKSAGVEIYALPPLTDQDRSDVTAAAMAAPPDPGARIDEALARIASSKSSAEVKAAIGGVAPQENQSESAAGSTSPAEPSAQNGDSQNQQQGTDAAAAAKPETAEPRKPPTLYGPDEKPEHK